MSYHKKIKPQHGEALSTPAAKVNGLDVAEIHAAIDRAHVLRAEQAGVLVKGLARAVRTVFYKLFGGFIATAKQRRAMAYLNGMSDHDLRDIGLSRAEIANAVVNGPSTDSLRARTQSRRTVSEHAVAEASVRHAA